MRSAVFKLPLPALRFPATLWAKAVLRAASKSINMAAARTQAGGHRRRCKGIIFLISLRRSELHKCCMILIAITSSCASEPRRSRFPCGKRVRCWLETPNGLGAQAEFQLLGRASSLNFFDGYLEVRDHGMPS